MHDKRTSKITLILASILVIFVVVATKSMFSKYKESITLDPANLSVSSEGLAEVFTLQEHKAVQNSDGTYSLEEEVVTSNTYQVVPSTILPKDPYFVITGKSNVLSYLYVEILDDSVGTNIVYDLTNDWKTLDVIGANGGTVYVYTGGESAAKPIDQSFSSNPLYVLQNNQVKINNVDVTKGVSLSFYGYLAQISNFDNPIDVYNICFGSVQ